LQTDVCIRRVLMSVEQTHIARGVGQGFIERNAVLLTYVNGWAWREVATFGNAKETETAYEV